MFRQDVYIIDTIYEVYPYSTNNTGQLVTVAY